MRRSIRTAAMLALTAVTFGCANAAKQGHGDSGPGTTLTSEQLAATNTENLYDAINKLRPSWLSSRGPTSVTNSTPTSVSIFMNGTNLGPVEALKDIRTLDVSQVRYFDAASASARFGMGHPRGVIELTRK